MRRQQVSHTSRHRLAPLASCCKPPPSLREAPPRGGSASRRGLKKKKKVPPLLPPFTSTWICPPPCLRRSALCSPACRRSALFPWLFPVGSFESPRRGNQTRSGVMTSERRQLASRSRPSRKRAVCGLPMNWVDIL